MEAGSIPVACSKRKTAFGRFFSWSRGERILSCRVPFPALIKRERGTAKVPLSHFPLLAVPKAHATLRGGFSLGAEGNTYFFGVPFPALIKRERGTAKVPLSHFPLLAIPKAHPSLRGGFSLGAEGSAYLFPSRKYLP